MPHKHLYMGAVNKNTKEYTFPIDATKRDIYCCPSCNNDIVFKKGKIKTPHFAHKAHSSCCYYSNPGESEIHKEGKRLMKKLLDNKENILVYRKCKCCGETEEVFNILKQDYTNEMICRLEFCFDYNENKRWADVALLNGDDVKFIFEICNTHKTSEERQTNYEWCEIDASTFINETMTQENLNEDNEIEIKCIRDIKCKKCLEWDKECLERDKERLEWDKTNALKRIIYDTYRIFINGINFKLNNYIPIYTYYGSDEVLCYYLRASDMAMLNPNTRYQWRGWRRAVDRSEVSHHIVYWRKVTWATYFECVCLWNKWRKYTSYCRVIERKKEQERIFEEQKKENARREEERKKEQKKENARREEERKKEQKGIFEEQKKIYEKNKTNKIIRWCEWRG